MNHDLLLCKEWKTIKKRILERYRYKCMKCGSSERLCVDHIIPRSTNPELALTESNLQILCWKCNEYKSNKTTEDHRPAALIPTTHKSKLIDFILRKHENTT